MSSFRIQTRISALASALLLLMAVNASAQPTPVLPGYSVSLLASGLSWPSGLVFRPRYHDLLVCQQNGNTVSRIDLTTGAVRPFGVVATPEHIATDSKNKVYVTTDIDNGPVTVFDSTGRAVDVFVVAGHADGLALDANDNLYLANNGTRLIVEYAAGSGFTNPTTFASGFRGLQGITFDGTGHLFAEDYIAGTVYYASPSGNSACATGLSSISDSMLDIAYVRSLGLLVSVYSGTVSQIPSKGKVNLFATGFSVAAGIAADVSQNIYVAEAATGSVWKFSRSAR
jgi:serine/threonine-protein kinase